MGGEGEGKERKRRKDRSCTSVLHRKKVRRARRVFRGEMKRKEEKGKERASVAAEGKGEKKMGARSLFAFVKPQ